MRGLQDRIAVVAGAAPGNIGAAAAQRLAEEGAVVLVADLNGEAAQAVADQLSAAGGRVHATQVDIAVDNSVQAMIDTAVRKLGGIHTLFNVAADLSPGTIGADSSHDVTNIPVEVWRRTLDVNLTGYMLTTRYALPHMFAAGSGSIVNTMSAAAWMAEPVRVAYSAAKAGVAALTRHTATIGGKQGVRCNAIAPGTVLTESVLRVLPAAERERQLADIPSTRLGTPEDIAALVAFLASDDGAWINGQTLSVDGGLTKR